MPSTSNHAVLLAAGLGSRLAPELNGRPKPLIEVGGRTLLARTLARLGEVGVDGVTIALGYRAADMYAALARLGSSARCVENTDPGGTGSMRSLALAAAAALSVDGWTHALVLEADVVFESRALRALLDAPAADATILVSGPTGAGDEVWVCGEGTRVSEITKRPADGVARLGELVGLSRVSRAMLEAMVAAHERAGAAAAREDYEVRISRMSAEKDVRVRLVEDLVWGEIDDADHLRRVREVVLPAMGERG